MVTDVTKMTFVYEVSNSGSGNGRGIFDDLTIESAPVLNLPVFCCWAAVCLEWVF
jgi:hypothetical protein